MTNLKMSISEVEARTLLEALDAYLPELAYEAARIKHIADRHPLVERERILRAFRERLATLEPGLVQPRVA